MGNGVTVSVRRTGEFRLEGVNSIGRVMIMDAPVSAGGADDGVRPVEAMLMSLAGCASVDVLTILNKQRQNLHDFEVTVEGDRVDAIPAVFDAIRIHFHVVGDIPPIKLEAAVKLSAEKYCSVAAMLEKAGVKLTWTTSVN